MAGEGRGSIGFFATYRPPVPLDIFSLPDDQTKSKDEFQMTDGVSSNYNGRVIPPEALRTILKRPIFASEKEVTEANVDSGIVFVSERDRGLETLHIAFRFNDNGNKQTKVKVFSFAEVFGTFDDVRMEDSGCIAGNYLIYVSTVDPADRRRQPWTAVYKTSLLTGRTDRLTPLVHADLSPSISPSGKKIAVASFQRKGGWHGEIEDLQTDIFVMNVEGPLERKLVVVNGGWPTWGDDNIIFFHRKVEKFWGVFRADVSDAITASKSEDKFGEIMTKRETRITPETFDAFTPAAIDPFSVAVATIRQKSDVRPDVQNYRHIEIFSLSGPPRLGGITNVNRPKADHYNPFVIKGPAGTRRIGYHRCRSGLIKSGNDIPKQLHRLKSPEPDVGLFRVPGAFPTFSPDGSKLAFIDNEFKNVWLADKERGLRIVYKMDGPDKVFFPVWNQNPQKELLYVCKGPSFQAAKSLHIYAITNVVNGDKEKSSLPENEKWELFSVTLARAKTNNAFPSTNPLGTKLVFRSTMDHNEGDGYKNLYIMHEIDTIFDEENKRTKATRLTKGDWTDTHCQWSPSGDWIVFSSNRDKPKDAPKLDNDLDSGFFAVYLVKWDRPSVVVRVIGSGNDLSGHVNHPFFSPDGKSIGVVSDLAAVSVDPISLPFFVHSVRPYGDIFTVDIDPIDINKNKDVKKFNRITHSRYENSTASWTKFSTLDTAAAWNLLLDKVHDYGSPHAYHAEGECWHLTGHLCVPKRCC